jgi:hypothetical protein
MVGAMTSSSSLDAPVPLRPEDFKLTDEEYDYIVHKLAQRVVDSAAAMADDVIRTYVDRDALVDRYWRRNTMRPITVSVNLGIEQCVGDLLLEILKMRRSR